MTKAELAQARELAQSDADLPDCVVLHGLYLRNFKPVTTTIPVVAALLRWQCVMLNGQLDGEEYAEFASVCKRKVVIA